MLAKYKELGLNIIGGISYPFDCVMGLFTVIAATILGWKPRFYRIMVFVCVVYVSWWLANVALTYLNTKYFTPEKLTLPPAVSSQLFVFDGYVVDQGLDLFTDSDIQSYFSLTAPNGDEFRIEVFTENNDDSKNQCTKYMMRTPSLVRTKTSEYLQSIEETLEDTTEIYSICRFEGMFTNVYEFKLFYDKESIKELIRRELEESVKVSGKAEEVSNVSSTDTEQVTSEKEEEEEKEKTLSSIDGDQKRAVHAFVEKYFQSPDLLNPSMSVFGRIDAIKYAMFVNGRIQFVTLMLFMFGLINLLCIFMLSVFGPLWRDRYVTESLLNSLYKFELVSSQMEINLRPVVASAEILPLIGFFGTIVGVSGAMETVGGVKSSDFLTEIRSLGAMTTNIGVAFETTKFALVLSAILTFFIYMTEKSSAVVSRNNTD